MTGKYIYKIENLLNNKFYIGQTVDPENRWNQHKRNHKSKIGQEIIKIGAENFSFEIIEFAEDYTTRENYWINYYNSIESGYNETEARYFPITIENNSLEVNQVRAIEEELMLGTTYIDIMNKFQCSSESITKVNRGLHLHSKESVEYPISKRANQEKYSKDIVCEIIHDLKYTELEIKAIAKKYGITNHTKISEINLGKHVKSPKNYHYPIRVKNFSKCNLQLETIWEIENILALEDRSFASIGLEYNIRSQTIKSINSGTFKGSYVMYFHYPLRGNV